MRCAVLQMIYFLLECCRGRDVGPGLYSRVGTYIVRAYDDERRSPEEKRGLRHPRARCVRKLWVGLKTTGTVQRSSTVFRPTMTTKYSS